MTIENEISPEYFNMDTELAKLGGGYACIVSYKEGSMVTIKQATSSNKFNDIIGFTSISKLRALTPYAHKPKRVVFDGTISGLDILDNNRIYSDNEILGYPIFYRPSIQKLSMTKSTDGILCGFGISCQTPYTETGSQAFESTIQINSNSNPGTFNLDDTVNFDDPLMPSDFGLKRLVRMRSDVGYENEQCQIYGGSKLLATFQPGAHAIYELTNAVKNADETWSSTWIVRTDLPLFQATASLHIDFLRTQAAKLHDDELPIKATLIASTSGRKNTWTLTSEAPSTITQDENKYLKIPSLDNHEIFRIACSEDGGVSWESKIVPMTTDLASYILLDGNVIIGVSSTGIRVNHVATGGSNYRVDTQIWLIDI